MRDTLQLLNTLRNNKTVDNTTYQNFRNLYRKELTKAKKTFNEQFIHKAANKPKAMWEIINKNKKKFNPNPDNSDNICASDFNLYFTGIAEKLIKTIPVQQLETNFQNYLSNIARPQDDFNFKEISYNDARDAILALSSSSAKDVYHINSKIIKTLVNVIYILLTKIFNKCIAENVFPNVLKISKVIPLFKKGDKDNMNNYRPISIVPTFSKVFEYLLKKQITKFFDNNNLFSKNQYGFRNNLSTTLAVNDLSEFVFSALENKEHVNATCFDLSKAFDCVTHHILLTKLGYYGFNQSSTDLLQSYLQNRQQFVAVNGMVSDNLSINCGVPQGSVLGPLLFLIYINDLPLALPKNKFTLFADDTTTCISSRSLMSLNIEIEHTQVQIFTWFTANKLVVNKDKTQSIIFSLRETGENSKSMKLLGIHLDTKMTWEAHADHLVKTISKKLFVLRQLRSEVNDKTLVTAYHALVHSNITYAILVWGHSTHLRKVFNQQRRCIRVLGGLGYRDDCRDIFKTFKILTVPCIYILQCVLYMYKNKDNYCSLNHSHLTRHHNLLLSIHSRLHKTQNSTRYYCVKFYNALPLYLKNMDFKPFKLHLKQLLTENAFYSFEEFYSFTKSL
jgi:hypothetical protein